MPARTKPGDALIKELRAFGLTYPGAHTKSPWPGHLDLAVNDKTFAYLSVEGEPASISCKLPHSAELALSLGFTSPTPYGLGKSGWVRAQLDEKALPPVDLFKSWIDESYRAQAPKKLIAQLDAGASKQPTKKIAKTAAKKPAKKIAKKPTKKKAVSQKR
jgi:hypothetical protein